VAESSPTLLALVKEAELPPPPSEFDDDVPLYAASKKIYPQKVKGTYRTIKWAVLLVTLGIYYLLPFVRWHRGASAPDQAVLIDLDGRRFYFFFIEIWPQEVYYITGLLILAAMVLFLMNAVAGRVWCGYLCPQTVWTDLFLAIERLIEGDRRERIRRDNEKWTAATYATKALKHVTWLMVAWWTGGAWVLYFTDAPTLVKELLFFEAPLIAYAWIGILTFTTYTLAGHMREQVCLYMCPWPRIQGALIDEYALNVTYRYDRGEPRCSLKTSTLLRAKGEPAGDCVECLQCVHVCPTGVDIRGGANFGCIQCGLCIDACDAVMRKLGRPERLIAYDTDLNIKRRQQGQAPFVRLIRLRTALYAAIIAVVGGVMLYTLATRQSEALAVIHDRNPMFVRLADGSLRNAYTVRILNKMQHPRVFELSVEGLDDFRLDIVGEPAGSRFHIIEVGPDQTRELRLLITSAQKLAPGEAIPLTFTAFDGRDGEHAVAVDHFRGP
jgi:cytochrome c oxidase accessory protein FixG